MVDGVSGGALQQSERLWGVLSSDDWTHERAFSGFPAVATGGPRAFNINGGFFACKLRVSV